eukprot:6021008-Prymnesium_polylepis.1
MKQAPAVSFVPTRLSATRRAKRDERHAARASEGAQVTLGQPPTRRPYRRPRDRRHVRLLRQAAERAAGRRARVAVGRAGERRCP